MIHFNELRISPEGDKLIIEAEVDNAAEFDNVSIASIVINTQKSFILNGPNIEKAAFIYNVKDNYDLVYSEPKVNSNNILAEDKANIYISEEGIKSIRLILDQEDLKKELPESSGCLKSDMFFVYVLPQLPEGSHLSDTPTIGTVVNLSNIYKESMYYINEINNTCDIPKDFIDSILKLRAIDMCIRTGNYPLAIKYWNKFYSSNKIINNCKCNERNYRYN